MKIVLELAAWTAAVALCATLAWAATSVDVNQSNRTFEKTAVTISAGDTLNFVNKDSVSHNVMARGDDAFNLGIMKPGETKSRKFDRKGSHEVTCALHPRMKMTVEVK